MFKKASLLLIFSLLLILFLTTFTVNKAYAAAGCCTGNTDKYCEASNNPCPPNVKSCDDNNNKIDPNVDINGNRIPGEQSDLYNPECFIPIVPPEQIKITDFGKLFSGAVAFLLLIAFIIAFIYLVLGGLSWITSGGDKAGVEAARNKIINALIGLIIVASTWALFQLVGGAIGFNILKGFNIPRLF